MCVKGAAEGCKDHKKKKDSKNGEGNKCGGDDDFDFGEFFKTMFTEFKQKAERYVEEKKAQQAAVAKVGEGKPEFAEAAEIAVNATSV